MNPRLLFAIYAYRRDELLKSQMKNKNLLLPIRREKEKPSCLVKVISSRKSSNILREIQRISLELLISQTLLFRKAIQRVLSASVRKGYSAKLNKKFRLLMKKHQMASSISLPRKKSKSTIRLKSISTHLIIKKLKTAKF